ncbi:MAG: O-antigen ligase family protein, partial [Bacteroidales bacterium]|nr:O-antigen ligase family protein [Bacteroidales bacterium]
FYIAFLLTTLLPYIPAILPFIPYQIFGFNMTGWAWMIMLLVTLSNLFIRKSGLFPFYYWLPWVFYMVVYLVIDFSYLGLQLTLQYTLPLLVGIVASGFTYTEEDIQWMFHWFIGLTIFIYLLFLWAVLFGSGYMPGMSVMPMLFAVAVSLLTAIFFITRRKIYLIFIAVLFIAPIAQMTRMGIAAIAAIFIFHFANKAIKSKIIYGAIGLLAFLLVFSSQKFQEKTFYSKQGTFSDLTLNYYDNPDIRSSGRISWKKALEPGLKTSPIWGNGPRADNVYLSKITKKRGGEAHNDYLSVRFNYGYVGLSLLLLGFAGSFISLYKISRKYIDSWYIWLISTSTLTLYIAFLMFMYTDNILKYTIYFPNYFFAMIGIVYSLKRDEDLRSDTSL